MKLDEIIPTKPEFTLSSTGKTYSLRIPNMEDRVEMIKICGTQEDLFKVFSERRWAEICRIVYRLLVQKADFRAEKEIQIDDSGFEHEVIVTGPIKLLRAIQTQSEAIAMIGALTTAITASEPVVKEFVENEVKKNLLESQIGEKSLMSSQVSMDTPQSSSGGSLAAS